ncbi:host cell division inhibitor Icd-like protein [Klebsiella pneumoniae]|uniref:host cell division inhibitor Icd-like protein n=1 Tax=Klebsiella pneumoniae TaxID=573 RepID=UPI002E812C82|nr:host cell division inhibitor Icd-like protein [Klebsiella pneumoniae]
MPAVQKRAFPLAGLMCTLRGIAHTHEGKAGITVPANASSSFSRRGDEESFETSTRMKIYWGSLREEDFSIITTRGGKIFLTSPLDAGNLCNSTRTREGEFLESIKKGSAYRSDHQQENQCYSPHVAAKSATGRGNPNTLRATQTPKASFFVSDHYAHQISGLVRTVSMVALVGLRSRRPVSFVSGISTPANVTAISERGNSGGDSLNTKEAAAMLATTPTQNPQFIWLIAAVRRDMPTITAKIHHIAAETEREARRTLARDHVCFFAGRIRTGGAHA